MISGLSVTPDAVRVTVRDRETTQLLRSHSSECPMCLDEIFGTRGCAYFEGIVEHRLLELSKQELRRRADVQRERLKLKMKATKEERDGEAR